MRENRTESAIRHSSRIAVWAGAPGAPPGPPAATRAQTEGVGIRQQEYQAALPRAQQLLNPTTLRDYGLISAAHDVLPPRPRMRGYPISHRSLFETSGMGLVVSEVGVEPSHVTLRALVRPDGDDFKIDKLIVLGLWGNRALFSIQADGDLPTSRRDWREMSENFAIKPMMNSGGSI